MKAFLVVVVVVAIVALAVGYILPSVMHSATGDSVAGSQPESVKVLETKFVSKIIDGDTVVAAGESIRLLGMDADERGYPCYTAAKLRLEELVMNRDVQLEMDTEDKDMYGRYLRFIFLNGTNIDLQLVEEGLAVARFAPGNTKYKDEMIDAENAAREAGIGCKWNGTSS